MSDYIDGWDMQDAISRCADAEAELMKLRQRHVKLVDFLRELERRMDVEWTLAEPRRTELHYWGHLIRAALTEVSDE